MPWKKLTDAQELEVVSDYSTSSSNELATKYGISRETVIRIIRKHGVVVRGRGSIRKHTLNEKVFDTITEESAYWIGFLMADGFVLCHKTKSPLIGILLSNKDRTHVEKFRSFLEASNPIGNGPPSSKTGEPSVNLRVSSKKLANVLSGFGVVPRKSYTAKVIGLEFNKHFWRGVIDGDGWLCLSKPTSRTGYMSPSIGIVGSEHLVEQFRCFVQTLCPSCEGKTFPRGGGRDARIRKYQISAKHARTVIQHLYEGASIGLDRKMKLAATAIIPPQPLTKCINGHSWVPENRRACNGGRTSYCILCQKNKNRLRFPTTE